MSSSPILRQLRKNRTITVFTSLALIVICVLIATIYYLRQRVPMYPCGVNNDELKRIAEKFLDDVGIEHSEHAEISNLPSPDATTTRAYMLQLASKGLDLESHRIVKFDSDTKHVRVDCGTMEATAYINMKYFKKHPVFKGHQSDIKAWLNQKDALECLTRIKQAIPGLDDYVIDGIHPNHKDDNWPETWQLTASRFYNGIKYDKQNGSLSIRGDACYPVSFWEKRWGAHPTNKVSLTKEDALNIIVARMKEKKISALPVDAELRVVNEISCVTHLSPITHSTKSKIAWVVPVTYESEADYSGLTKGFIALDAQSGRELSIGCD